VQGLLDLTDLALQVGLALTRLALAFLMLPMLTQEALPALVRNTLFVGLAISAVAALPPLAPVQADAMTWLGLFGKEALIGLAFGLFSSTMLWAVEMAGTLIDTKAGTQMAQIVDPVNGQASSNTGVFLARLSTYVFMASGGFMFMVGALLESYAVWPVGMPITAPRPEAVAGFESEFARLMLLTTMIAAPIIVILFIAEATLGLINKFAPSLNLLALAPPVKALLTTLMIAMLLGTVIDLLVHEFTTRHVDLLRWIARVMGR
jgi:type III secretion protein T